MEDVNTRQRFSFPFSELRYSLLEFNSRKTLPTFRLRASSPIWASQASLARRRERGAEDPCGFAARSRVLARLVLLAQIGELARRLPTFDELSEMEEAR